MAYLVESPAIYFYRFQNDDPLRAEKTIGLAWKRLQSLNAWDPGYDRTTRFNAYVLQYLVPFPRLNAMKKTEYFKQIYTKFASDEERRTILFIAKLAIPQKEIDNLVSSGSWHSSAVKSKQCFEYFIPIASRQEESDPIPRPSTPSPERWAFESQALRYASPTNNLQKLLSDEQRGI